MTGIAPAPHRQRRSLAVGLALAVVGVVVAGAVLWLGPGGGEGRAEAAGATGFQSGPQGLVPQFIVTCAFSHTAPDDPIVFPGEPGQSHQHDFFGNRATDAWSTPTPCSARPPRASASSTRLPTGLRACTTTARRSTPSASTRTTGRDRASTRPAWCRTPTGS